MERLKQLVLKLWHPGCWSIEITKNHPEIYLVVTNAFKILDEIRANFRAVAENYDALNIFLDDLKDYNHLAKDITVVGKSNLTAFIHGRFTPQSTFYDQVFALDVMPVKIVIHRGFEYWTVLVYEENLKKAVGGLEEIENAECEVISIANLKEFEVYEENFIEEISSELSTKQKKVLLEAYKAGYFEWPRRINLAELSEKFGIAKSTCLHHIRSGEQKILSRFLEELWKREKYLEK